MPLVSCNCISVVAFDLGLNICVKFSSDRGRSVVLKTILRNAIDLITCPKNSVLVEIACEILTCKYARRVYVFVAH